MMLIIDHILKAFEYNEFPNIKEDFEVFEANFTLEKLLVPKRVEIINLREDISSRDNLFLSVSGWFGDANISKFDEESVDAFLSEIEENVHYGEVHNPESHDISITLRCRKSIDAKRLSVYSVDDFLGWLNALTLEDKLGVLKENCLSYGQVCLVPMSEKTEFGSELIYFSSDETIPHKDTYRRTKKSHKQNESCHFLNASEYPFVTSDFELIEEPDISGRSHVFDQLATIFSIISISNISSIQGSKLSYSINGYRPLREVLALDEISFNKSLIDISRWVYSEGSVTDKIGLARNIITIYITKNILDLERSALNSVKSNYEIYLKDNIQRYLEIKRDISHSLVDLRKQATQLVDGFVSSFKGNFVGFFTFFISVLLIGVVRGSTPGDLFAGGLVWISYGLLFVSFLYWVASLIEYQGKIKRFKDEYHGLKSRYQGLLDEGDVVLIFENDSPYKREVNFLNKQRIAYSSVWLLAIIVFSILVSCL